MQDDRLEIVNEALIFLGEAPLNSLRNNDSPRAVIASALWSSALREVLRSHPWNFATKRMVLEAEAGQPTFGFSYQFPKPPDWIRTLAVDGTGNFRHEGEKILADVATLRLRYIYLVESVRNFDAIFRAAFVRNLAHKLCYPITKSTSKESELWDKYVQLLGQARQVDAQEDPNDADEFGESSLLLARRR